MEWRAEMSDNGVPPQEDQTRLCRHISTAGALGFPLFRPERLMKHDPVANVWDSVQDWERFCCQCGAALPSVRLVAA